MITGLIKADAGRIELDGRDVSALPMYQRARLGIGYLPQEQSIFRGLNVEENVRAVLEIVEPDRRKRERDLNGLLDEFNIGRLRKTPSIALSGGERRRVEIARALASRPNYMLVSHSPLDNCVTRFLTAPSLRSAVVLAPAATSAVFGPSSL